MKIAITGHTSGFGQALFQQYPDALGYSRTNGYDLLKSENIQRMIDEIRDCDVFINNAFPAVAADSVEGMETQLRLLYDVYKSWQSHDDRLIINIGSNTSDGIKKHFWPYAAAKAGLDKGCEQLAYMESGPRVSNVRFGYIDLPHVHKINPEAKKIDINVAVGIIETVIETHRSGHTIRELTVLP